MSTKPHPIACTSAMLTHRQWIVAARGQTPTPHQGHPLSDTRPVPTAYRAADLASRLHRLSKGAHRASVAECNGELFDGQRLACLTMKSPAFRQGALDNVQKSVERYCARIDRQIANLSQELAPLGITASRNTDPNGFAILLTSVDQSRPLPSNGMEAGVWGVS